MSDRHFSFRDSDTAWRVREEINHTSRYLPASQGIFGGGSGIILKMDEFIKDTPETQKKILSIIANEGGKEW